MVDINVCHCVGRRKLISQAGKSYTISYFTYNLSDKTQGQGVFQTFDDCEIGKSYNFIMQNFKPCLVNKL